MDWLQILEGIFLGSFIGFVLATVGAGGAILAVPGLVGFFSFSTTTATTSSLVIVGAAAFMGSVQKFKTKAADIKLGLIFSLLGVVGTYVGTRLVEVVSETFVLLTFATLMAVSAYGMWNKKPLTDSNKTPNQILVLLVATAVGLITGLLGIGGGFLIVPTLVLALGINAKLAVGTSLVAITTNAIIALGFRNDYWSDIPWQQVGVVAVSAVLVSAFAAPLSHKLSEIQIQKAFAILLALLTIYMVALTF